MYNELNKLKNINRKLERFLGNIMFGYEEQELIRRVIKSVFTQLKSDRDKATAEDILEKTRWIDGE